MGSLFKSGSQTTTQKSSSEPWKPAQSNLKDILGDVSDWYNQAQKTGYISPTGDLSSIYSQYLQGLNGVSSDATNTTNSLLGQGNSAAQSALSGYQNAANGGLGYSTGDIANAASSLYNNDLVQNQIDAANRQIDNTLNEQTFTGIDRNAVAGGNAGSSRAGVAQAIAARDAAQMKADNANTITGNAYNNAINTAANTLSNNSNMQLAGLAGTASTGNQLYSQGGNYASSVLNGLSPQLQSSQLSALIQQQQQTDATGNRDYLANLISQYYLPVSGSIAGLGGTTSGSSTQPGGSSLFNSLLSGGAAASQIYQGFSDKRLKKNIRKVGTEAGHNVYEWEWTKRGKELAGNQPARGVIAQEVLKKKPEAVSTDPNTGFLIVDYSKL